VIVRQDNDIEGYIKSKAELTPLKKKKGGKMIRINAPEKEDGPLVRNGWTLVHDVPLSTQMKDYVIQRRIEDFIDEETDGYI